MAGGFFERNAVVLFESLWGVESWDAHRENLIEPTVAIAITLVVRVYSPFCSSARYLNP